MEAASASNEELTATAKEGQGDPHSTSASLSLRLVLVSTLVLVLAILLQEGDGVPAASPGEEAEVERLSLMPEVSPFRGDGPFRVHNTTHGQIPAYSHNLAGWGAYLGGALPAPVMLLFSYLAFGWNPARMLQMLELMQTVGMITGGAFASYPRFPVPTPFHGIWSRVAGITRILLPSHFMVPLVVTLILGKFQRTRFLVDPICIYYAALDTWPSLVGEFHVNERPMHNLRLLVLCLGSEASRLRAWGAIMGLFYIGTGGPKLLPSFYRYWLWFGIYPSSTLSDFPPSWFFYRGTDGGWHPNFLAQAFGFCGGLMEVAFAALILVSASTSRRLRAVLASAIHLGIIFGRFDNGLSGWNSCWLLEDIVHSLSSEPTGAWGELSPWAAGVVAVQGTFGLLFFLGHGSYHTGMSHHTGNFRMQWLLFQNASSWKVFESVLAQVGHGEACQHGPLHGHPTCVHSWGHGTHYPTASFGTFLYALNGGTYLQEVLPLQAAVEDDGFGPNLEYFGSLVSQSVAVAVYTAERNLRQAHHDEYTQQVEALVGGHRFSRGGRGQLVSSSIANTNSTNNNNNTNTTPWARAVYLGFASGSSIWDDSFYEPAVANLVRQFSWWKPGEVLFIEVDRQRPWRRVRRVRTWDLSRELPETTLSLIDRLLGSSPRAHLLEERRLVVRRPFLFS